jgi:hypothetical protein
MKRLVGAALGVVTLIVAVGLLTGASHPSHAERPNGGREAAEPHITEAPREDLSAGLLRAQGFVEHRLWSPRCTRSSVQAVGRYVAAVAYDQAVAEAAAQDAPEAYGPAPATARSSGTLIRLVLRGITVGECLACTRLHHPTGVRW